MLTSTIKKNLEEKLKVNDFKRSYAWVEKQFNKGRLMVYSTGGDRLKMDENSFKSLTIFIKNTIEIYDDNWDILFDVSVDRNSRKIYFTLDKIYLYFPPFYISTGPGGDSHLITDLYVSYKFSYYRMGNRLIIEDILGMRASATSAEIDSSYVHSHLNTYNYNINNNESFPRWTSFCLGSGHINDIQADLNSLNVFDDEHIIAILVQTQGLVSHESEEGGPYIYMRDIGIKEDESSNILFSQYPEGTIRSLIKGIIDSNVHATVHRNSCSPLDINESNGVFEVQDTKALDDYFRNHPYFLENGNARNTLFWWIPSYNGLPSLDTSTYKHVAYVGTRTNSNASANEKERIIPGSFYFQGKEITFKHILEEEFSEIENDLGEMDYTPIRYEYQDYTIPPQYRKTILKYLTNELNKKTIRQSTLDRHQN